MSRIGWVSKDCDRYSYVGNNPYKYTDPTGMTRKSSYQQCEDDPQCENVIPQGDSASNPRNGNGAGDLKIEVSVKGIVSAAYSRNEGLTAEIAGSKHGFSLKANSNGEVSIGVNTLQGSEMSFRLNDSEKSYLHQIAQFKSLSLHLKASSTGMLEFSGKLSYLELGAISISGSFSPVLALRATLIGQRFGWYTGENFKDTDRCLESTLNGSGQC